MEVTFACEDGGRVFNAVLIVSCGLLGRPAGGNVRIMIKLRPEKSERSQPTNDEAATAKHNKRKLKEVYSHLLLRLASRTAPRTLHSRAIGQARHPARGSWAATPLQRHTRRARK